MSCNSKKVSFEGIKSCRQSAKSTGPSLYWRSSFLPGSFDGLPWVTSRLEKRKVVTRSPHRRVGRLSAPWLQDVPIAWESQLELAFLKQALFCPGVVSIQSEPFTLDLHSDEFLNVRTRYSPDFLIKFDNGKKLIIEVRHSSRLDQDLGFFNCFADHVVSVGYSFAVITDDVILATQSRLDNADFLYRYAQDLEAISLAVPPIDAGRELFVGTLPELAAKLQISTNQALTFVAQHNFDFDLHREIKSVAVLAELPPKVGDEYFYSKNWFRV